MKKNTPAPLTVLRDGFLERGHHLGGKQPPIIRGIQPKQSFVDSSQIHLKPPSFSDVRLLPVLIASCDPTLSAIAYDQPQSVCTPAFLGSCLPAQNVRSS